MKVPDITALLGRLRRRSAALVLVWLALVLGLAFPYFEATRNANERPRLLQGMALVDEGSWAIDGPAARGLSAGPDVSRSEADGRLYPNKPPATSLVAAAAYRGARALETTDAPLTLRTYTWWARLLGGLLPTLLLCAWLLRRYTPAFGPAITASAVTLYALGTPAASYAHLLYGHQLAALLLAVGTGLVLDADPPSQSARPALVRAALGGALAGSAVAVEYGAVFGGLPLAVLLLARVRRPHGPAVLVAGLLGALVPIALLAAYHHAAFGSPWSTGYHHVTNAEFAAKHGEGLLGLGWPRWEAFHTHWLSADGGLVWWAPPLVLALYGLVRLARVPGPACAEARVHLGLVLLYGLLVASLSFEGGWRVGPRYLVVVLPSLVLGWAHALALWRTRALGMAVVLALGTCAVVVNALAANLWPHFDLTNVNQPVAEVLLPLWEHDARPYGVVRAITGRSELGLVVAGSVLGLWVALAATIERGSRMAVACTAGAALGLLLVQVTRLVEPHPKGARNLAYIERIWEPTAKGPGKSAILPALDDALESSPGARRPSPSDAAGGRAGSRHRLQPPSP
jgi:hypothetical protein